MKRTGWDGLVCAPVLKSALCMTDGSIDESWDCATESDLMPDVGNSTLELLYNL